MAMYNSFDEIKENDYSLHPGGYVGIDESNKLSEEDLFNKSMVTSLSDAQANKEYLLTVIEINDRYSYNIDRNHETGKDDLRGMIIEIKNILNNKLYEKI